MAIALRLTVLLCFPMILAAVLSAQKITVSQPTIWASKPDIAAFEKIENERLAAGQKAIEQLLAVQGARTIENTLVPFDEASRQNNSAGYFAGLMEQIHPDAAFRDHATAMLTKATAAQTAIALNHEVYNAIAAIDLSKADAATAYYVKRQLLEFRLAGVDKDDATRARLKKLSDQATEEQSMFDRNISDGKLTIEAVPAELDGLPQDYIDRHKPDANGKVHLTTDYPDAFPVLSFAKSDALRRRMAIAFGSRAYPKNQEVLTSLMKTRYEIASLIGYPSWADYNAADKMIAKGLNIAAFIQQVNDASRALSEREFEMLLAEKRKTDPGAKEIFNYEASYLSEQVRRNKYDFPSTKSSKASWTPPPIFFMSLFSAKKTFPRGIPRWRPTSSSTTISPLAASISTCTRGPASTATRRWRRFSTASAASNSRKRFWSATSRRPRTPIPASWITATSAPSSMNSAISCITSSADSSNGPASPGISMESDFVEAPSQMLEEWIRSPQVLAKFARHYKTGEPIPAELVARMNRASAFGRGGWVSRQNSFSAIFLRYLQDQAGRREPGHHRERRRSQVHSVSAHAGHSSVGQLRPSRRLFLGLLHLSLE
jgi:thimet oligopeptidase